MFALEKRLVWSVRTGDITANGAFLRSVSAVDIFYSSVAESPRFQSWDEGIK